MPPLTAKQYYNEVIKEEVLQEEFDGRDNHVLARLHLIAAQFIENNRPIPTGLDAIHSAPDADAYLRLIQCNCNLLMGQLHELYVDRKQYIHLPPFEELVKDIEAPQFFDPDALEVTQEAYDECISRQVLLAEDLKQRGVNVLDILTRSPAKHLVLTIFYENEKAVKLNTKIDWLQRHHSKEGGSAVQIQRVWRGYNTRKQIALIQQAHKARVILNKVLADLHKITCKAQVPTSKLSQLFRDLSTCTHIGQQLVIIQHIIHILLSATKHNAVLKMTATERTLNHSGGSVEDDLLQLGLDAFPPFVADVLRSLAGTPDDMRNDYLGSTTSSLFGSAQGEGRMYTADIPILTKRSKTHEKQIVSGSGVTKGVGSNWMASPSSTPTVGGRASATSDATVVTSVPVAVFEAAHSTLQQQAGAPVTNGEDNYTTWMFNHPLSSTLDHNIHRELVRQLAHQHPHTKHSTQDTPLPHRPSPISFQSYLLGLQQQVEVLNNVVQSNVVAAQRVTSTQQQSSSAVAHLDTMVIQHAILHGIPLLHVPTTNNNTNDSTERREHSPHPVVERDITIERREPSSHSPSPEGCKTNGSSSRKNTQAAAAPQAYRSTTTHQPVTYSVEHQQPQTALTASHQQLHTPTHATPNDSHTHPTEPNQSALSHTHDPSLLQETPTPKQGRDPVASHTEATPVHQQLAPTAYSQGKPNDDAASAVVVSQQPVHSRPAPQHESRSQFPPKDGVTAQHVVPHSHSTSHQQQAGQQPQHSQNLKDMSALVISPHPVQPLPQQHPHKHQYQLPAASQPRYSVKTVGDGVPLGYDDYDGELRSDVDEDSEDELKPIKYSKNYNPFRPNHLVRREFTDEEERAARIIQRPWLRKVGRIQRKRKINRQRRAVDRDEAACIIQDVFKGSIQSEWRQIEYHHRNISYKELLYVRPWEHAKRKTIIYDEECGRSRIIQKRRKNEYRLNNGGKSDTQLLCMLQGVLRAKLSQHYTSRVAESRLNDIRNRQLQPPTSPSIRVSDCNKPSRTSPLASLTSFSHLPLRNSNSPQQDLADTNTASGLGSAFDLSSNLSSYASMLMTLGNTAENNPKFYENGIAHVNLNDDRLAPAKLKQLQLQEKYLRQKLDTQQLDEYSYILTINTSHTPYLQSFYNDMKQYPNQHYSKKLTPIVSDDPAQRVTKRKKDQPTSPSKSTMKLIRSNSGTEASSPLNPGQRKHSFGGSSVGKSTSKHSQSQSPSNARTLKDNQSMHSKSHVEDDDDEPDDGPSYHNHTLGRPLILSVAQQAVFGNPDARYEGYTDLTWRQKYSIQDLSIPPEKAPNFLKNKIHNINNNHSTPSSPSNRLHSPIKSIRSLSSRESYYSRGAKDDIKREQPVNPEDQEELQNFFLSLNKAQMKQITPDKVRLLSRRQKLLDKHINAQLDDTTFTRTPIIIDPQNRGISEKFIRSLNYQKVQKQATTPNKATSRPITPMTAATTVSTNYSLVPATPGTDTAERSVTPDHYAIDPILFPPIPRPEFPKSNSKIVSSDVRVPADHKLGAMYTPCLKTKYAVHTVTYHKPVDQEEDQQSSRPDTSYTLQLSGPPEFTPPEEVSPTNNSGEHGATEAPITPQSKRPRITVDTNAVHPRDPMGNYVESCDSSIQGDEKTTQPTIIPEYLQYTDKRVVASDVSVPSPPLSHLIQHNCLYLNIVDIKNQCLNDITINPLVEALHTNTTVTIFILDENDIHDCTGLNLAAMLTKNRTLRILSLQCTFVTDVTAVQMMKSVAKNPKINKINVDNTEINAANNKQLQDMLRGRHLQLEPVRKFNVQQQQRIAEANLPYNKYKSKVTPGVSVQPILQAHSLVGKMRQELVSLEVEEEIIQAKKNERLAHIKEHGW